ncbi:MAG: SagB family peptide dehydrogenase [Acidimicrobiia bacterium]|nr:SagB family peptide dehydrogenase [Acidimicrobiia bacterium]
MTMYPRAAADAIHHSTKHGTPAAHPQRLVSYRRLDPDNAPTPFKKYRDLPISPLSRELVDSTLPAVRVLGGERGNRSALDGSLLATLLYLAAGVTRVTAGSARGRIFFRAAMSAGNLHPVEVYVIAGPGVDGVPAGMHHFAPLEFGLTELRRGDFRAALSVTAPAALVLTGLVWRTAWKYGERGWRHLYWDAGTMLANLVAAADAHGLGVRILSGFADETVSRLVGIDGVEEVPLAVVTLGYESGDVEPGPISNRDPAPLSVNVAPVAPRPMRLPLLVEAQAESTLTADDVTRWRQAAIAVSSEMPAHIDPPPSGPKEPIEAVILRRGSTRVMRHEPVAHNALVWPLAAATRAVPLDAAPRGTLLEHYVNVHAVDGVRPGAYRWEHGDVEFITGDDSPREIGRLLCLDQPLGGDSAYTVFHNAALDPILDVLGSRGYRAAQLEAGIVSGRLALSAFALGLGATGLTFIDDLVARYFHTTTAPMLVTSVGVPDTPPAPAGRPGEPVTLRRRTS